MKKITLLLAIAFTGTILFAQSDEPAPKKHEGTWHTLVFIDFKAGKAGDARKIIAKYVTASETAGTPEPQSYWMETGSYDMMLIWDLKEGPSDLEWSWSPDGVAWWNAFVAQEGSKEAAEKIQEEYTSLVSGSTSHIIRKEK
jgi:hypothetical protein